MRTLIICLSTAIMLLGACGAPGPQQASTGTSQEATGEKYEFTINAIGNTMMDMAYDTKELKVKAGSQVKVNLTNKGTDAAMLHNIVFVKQGSEKEVAMEGMAHKEHNYFNSENPNVIAGSEVTTPGASTSLVFTAPEAGTYAYICTYPGHWQKMQGILIVE